MTAEIHFLAAWRSKGDRRAPTQEQIRDARLCSARERLRQIQADAADYEAQVEKLDQRLEANVTLKGKNRGKPLSKNRRTLLSQAHDWKLQWLKCALEECPDLDKRIAELEGRTEKPPA